MAKAKPKPKKNKPLTAAEREQPQIPQLADEKNPKVHRAGLNLQDGIDEVKRAQDAVKTLKATLLAIMKMEKVKHYRYGDIDTEIVSTEKVKVKRVAPEKKVRKKADKKPKGDSLANSEDPPPVNPDTES